MPDAGPQPPVGYWYCGGFSPHCWPGNPSGGLSALELPGLTVVAGESAGLRLPRWGRRPLNALLLVGIA